MEVEGSVIEPVSDDARVENRREEEEASGSSFSPVMASDTPLALVGEQKYPLPTLSERMEAIMTDGALNVEHLTSFVIMLRENSSDPKDQYLLMEPLLVCDTATMKRLVTSHGLLQILESWIQRSQASDAKILRLLLKLTEKALRRIQEAPHYMQPQLVEQLKSLRSHTEPEIASMASSLVAALRFSVGDNYDHDLDTIREHLQEHHKRSLAETASENDFDETPSAKRLLTSDPNIKNDEMIDLNMAQDRMLKAAAEEQISAKTGKPKKRVTWATEEILTSESLFYKAMPVQYDGTIDDFEASERRPSAPDWKLVSIAWGTHIPAFTLTHQQIVLTPTRSVVQERERQKTASIALYLSDADIPPNPQEPSLQDSMNMLKEKFAATPAIIIPPTREAARRTLTSAPGKLQRVQLNPHAAPTPAPASNTQFSHPGNQQSQLSGTPTETIPAHGPPRFAPPPATQAAQPYHHPAPAQHQAFPSSAPHPTGYAPNNYGPQFNPEAHPAPGSHNPYGPHNPPHNPHGPPHNPPPHNPAPTGHWQPPGPPMAHHNAYNGGYQAPHPGYGPPPPQPSAPYHSPHPMQPLANSAYAPRPMGAPGYAPHPLHLQQQQQPPQHLHLPPPGYAPQHAVHQAPPPNGHLANYPPQPSAPYQQQHHHEKPEKPKKSPKKKHADPSSIVHPSEVLPTAFPFSRLKTMEDRARFVCNHWRRTATCEYGETCKFLHPKDNSRF